jgi:hypothetical protein
VTSISESDIPDRRAHLIARPGARFQCLGDGLCCTDLHALGPLTRDESRDLQSVAPGALAWNEEFMGDCLRVDAQGNCLQLERDGRCGIQRRFGVDHKPIGCRRFPYGLVDTPLGRRVTTEHRCPCRSLGGDSRPPIDLADASACLQDRDGQLEADGEVPDAVSMSRATTAPFSEYAMIEADMLRRLAEGVRAEDVLDADPLPDCNRLEWTACGRDFVGMQDGSAGGVALAWFGEALLERMTGATPVVRGRPWRGAFERGIARTPLAADPEHVVNDWLADELWMLRWLEWQDCPFTAARSELATRLDLVRALMRRLDGLGLRGDQSAAEAVMLAGLASCTTRWPRQVADFVDRSA